ncbi:Oidioi.mRNA.OKI2018_I69.PAR.g9564.t1.cds [Oikopleura dioica]|uniref:Oidioi.mRNA.OKI2018_I69.PAR.g9564.t1.cds n=1 Tax=Oikopleura dioica TaxID=34765 RepID=A0ABN7RPU0_OIKDI|nr:Oidioi.mRNA.OKI2018_I69.PAR.g9564.t1.cds [Oikopleura dioica]
MKLGSETFEGCVKDLKLGSAPIGLGLQPGIDPDNAPSDDLVFFPTDDDFCISTECAFDSCIYSSCSGNGACISDSEVHLCICNEEFVGDYCNITAACQDIDCGDFGYCIGMNNGTCICDEGFEGENCEVNIDDCESSSCSRFSTCIDGVNSYECSCDSGFFGPHCTITKNSTCADSPCLDDEQCVPVDIKSMEFNFKCVKKGPDCVEPCPEGLVCRQDQCVPIDYCEFVDECQKNSYCWVKNNTASCVCLPGWEGESCEIDFDECAVHSSHGEPVCSEFGTCINMPGTYRCECMDGITGPFCTIDVDECIENPCKNSGRCENEFGGYKCYCYREFYGENCEFACRPGTCQNDGVCLTEDLENGNQGWSCNCPEHIYGEKCEHISPCYSVPCGAENECVVNVTEIASGKNKNKFECECSEGLTGKLCNFEDRCFTDDPCLNGPCTPEDDKFFCDCTDTGFSGQTCGEDIDECSLEIDPCGDHGSCFNTPGSFTCECDDGYSGILCEIKDLCFEVSCSDQGQCDPSTGFCICNPGFLPPDCSEIDNCFEVTCLNNGTCAEGLCACDDRWVGQNCEFENPCEEDLCGNGRCKVDEMSGQAECECNFGYIGKQCIQEVTCEFLECPSSQTCIDESPPKCIDKTPQNPKDKKDQRTNEKLGGSVIETQGTLESGLTHTPSTVALPWIIVISVIGSIIVIGLITFLAVLRSKRRATGTYSPTRHEKQPEVIKQTMWKSLESPEPERLI